jgi:hypothetical protein
MDSIYTSIEYSGSRTNVIVFNAGRQAVFGSVQLEIEVGRKPGTLAA